MTSSDSNRCRTNFLRRFKLSKIIQNKSTSCTESLKLCKRRDFKSIIEHVLSGLQYEEVICMLCMNLLSNQDISCSVQMQIIHSNELTKSSFYTASNQIVLCMHDICVQIRWACTTELVWRLLGSGVWLFKTQYQLINIITNYIWW